MELPPALSFSARETGRSALSYPLSEQVTENSECQHLAWKMGTVGTYISGVSHVTCIRSISMTHYLQAFSPCRFSYEILVLVFLLPLAFLSLLTIMIHS